MNDSTIAITGIGLVSSIGSNLADAIQFWKSGQFARTQKLPIFTGTPLDERRAAQLPLDQLSDRIRDRRLLKYMSESAVLGCVAAREAMDDSQAKTYYAAERIGIYAGAGLASADVRDVNQLVEASIDEGGELSAQLIGERGLDATHPLLSFKILPNMPACLISILEGIKGPNYIFTPWEGQTSAAFVEAIEAIRAGDIDCAVVGASDTAAAPMTYLYLAQQGLISEREFPSSGAGYLVLEKAESVRRNQRRMYCQIASIALENTDGNAYDPFADRIGRSFAAAPAINLALTIADQRRALEMTGVDHARFCVELEYPQ